MQSNGASLPTRGDTFFGVCEGLGEDLGIHSNLIRLAFAGLLFWNPLAALISYMAAGLFVAALRWMVPNAPSAEAPLPAVDAALQDEAAQDEQLPLAA